MNTKILITGGAGYIGSHTAKLLLENGYDLIIFDNLVTGFKGAVDALNGYVQKGQNLEFIKGDLLNQNDISRALSGKSVDAVIHFAAFCSVGESMTNPGKYFKTNILGTVNLLEAMKENKVDKLIFSSTCATYGEAEYLPIDEKHPQNPVIPYGESKLMAEKIIKWYERIFGIKYLLLRYFNPCGASEDGVIGDSKKPSVHLVQNIVRGALGIEPFQLTCPKVDTPDGSPIRDYINIEDLAHAHLLALNYLTKGETSNVFNIGTGKGNSVLEIVSEVEKVLSVKIDRVQGEARQGEYAKIYADYSKAQKLLGWEPKHTLEESIKSLAKWYKGHPQGFES